MDKPVEHEVTYTEIGGGYRWSALCSCGWSGRDYPYITRVAAQQAFGQHKRWAAERPPASKPEPNS